jgi:hypothetical protein
MQFDSVDMGGNLTSVMARAARRKSFIPTIRSRCLDVGDLAAPKKEGVCTAGVACRP